MSIEFSTNISTLRRERNISQKEAAEALGISQALLSHYEKGIRECNLDFVKKTASYYDVSSDFLLGLSQSRHGTDELNDSEEQPGDSQMKMKTLMRSFFYLTKLTAAQDEAEQMFFTDYFTLCIKRYQTVLSGKNDGLEKLCAFGTDYLTRSAPINEKEKTTEAPPLFLKTLDEHAMFLLNTDIAEIFR